MSQSPLRWWASWASETHAPKGDWDKRLTVWCSLYDVKKGQKRPACCVCVWFHLSNWVAAGQRFVCVCCLLFAYCPSVPGVICLWTLRGLVLSLWKFQESICMWWSGDCHKSMSKEQHNSLEMDCTRKGKIVDQAINVVVFEWICHLLLVGASDRESSLVTCSGFNSWTLNGDGCSNLKIKLTVVRH